jgi:hypothetical protein
LAVAATGPGVVGEAELTVDGVDARLEVARPG